MPRVRTELTQPRRAAIIRDLLADTLPAKAIAANHSVSTSWVRNTMWNAGYRSMIVSSTERASLLAARKAAPQLATPATLP